MEGQQDSRGEGSGEKRKHLFRGVSNVVKSCLHDLVAQLKLTASSEQHDDLRLQNSHHAIFTPLQSISQEVLSL